MLMETPYSFCRFSGSPDLLSEVRAGARRQSQALLNTDQAWSPFVGPWKEAHLGHSLGGFDGRLGKSNEQSPALWSTASSGEVQSSITDLG